MPQGLVCICLAPARRCKCTVSRLRLLARGYLRADDAVEFERRLLLFGAVRRVLGGFHSEPCCAPSSVDNVFVQLMALQRLGQPLVNNVSVQLVAPRRFEQPLVDQVFMQLRALRQWPLLCLRPFCPRTSASVAPSAPDRAAHGRGSRCRKMAV